MKNYLPFLILAFLLAASAAHAQTSVINDLASVQADLQTQQSKIVWDNSVIAQMQADIATRTAQETTDNASIAQDNALIAQYNALNAQTPATVNWEAIDILEKAGIRYTQWSAAQPGVNWTSIIPAIGITCSPTESAVNWNNMDNCEAQGVVMGQPYGNWTTGMAAFMCGNGSISGAC